MRRLRFHHWPILICTAAIALALAACSPATAEPTTTPTGTPTAFHTPQPTATATAVPTATPTPLPTATPTLTPSPTPTLHPLTIAAMRLREYPGSPLTIEQTLDAGANYRRYIASYRSDGLKINGLLTVPDGDRPATGWPVIVFIHGYIPPEQYRTTERYVAYVDGFARNGYIVFKVDLRGHGSSEGNAQGAYGSTDYTVDVLNAVAALRQYPDADPARFGMWGHSMGGYLTLNAMVITRDIRAGVVWAGMVVSPADLLERWRTPTPGPSPTPPPDGTPGPGRRGWRELLEQYGKPADNPEFWAAISANNYLADLSGPLQLHHSTTDETVPYWFSESLTQELTAAGQYVEFYTYEGDNHNLSASFGTAMARSVEFFDKYVKGAVASP